jgi:hypothetical protein
MRENLEMLNETEIKLDEQILDINAIGEENPRWLKLKEKQRKGFWKAINLEKLKAEEDAENVLRK